MGQGALAIECRQGDTETLNYIGVLQDRESALACIAERAFMRTLEGGCSAPVAAHAEIKEDGICLEGGVWSLDGQEERREKMERKLESTEGAKKAKTDSEMVAEFASVVASGPMLEQEMKVAEELGETLAKKLLDRGAGKILAEAKATINQ